MPDSPPAPVGLDDTSSTTSRPPEFVQSLERGLAVIKAFDHDHNQLTLSEVAQRTGLTRAGARRFLITLRELGYVNENSRRFSLRPRVLELGYAMLSSTPLADIATEHLRDAAADMRESCSASALEGAEIVYIARAASSRIMTVNLSIGSRLPAAFTSMGRVLLAGLPSDQLDTALEHVEYRHLTEYSVTNREALIAELDKVRAQGWCLIDQEREIGVRSIAVPLRHHSGRVIAAINTSVNASRVSIDTMTGVYLTRLQEARDRIEADLRLRMEN